MIETMDATGGRGKCSTGVAGGARLSGGHRSIVKLSYYSLGFACGAAAASWLTYHRVERARTEEPAAEIRETVRVERVTVSDPAVVAEVGRLTKENAEMRKALDEARTRLLDNDALLKHTEAKLDELRRPMTADIMSSSLRAEMQPGEAIVTGGYRVADGKRLYAFATPVVETVDGKPTVRIESRYVEVTDEVGASVGLDALATNAANTLQHGEVWIADEQRDVLAKLAGAEGADVVQMTDLSVAAGVSGTISVGGIQLKVTPELAETGGGLNVELRLEQPAVTPSPPVSPEGS